MKLPTPPSSLNKSASTATTASTAPSTSPSSTSTSRASSTVSSNNEKAETTTTTTTTQPTLRRASSSTSGEETVEERTKATNEINKMRSSPGSKIPNSQYWKLLRKSYFKSKGSSDPEWDADLREFLCEVGPCGALVPYEIRTDGQYGRGVFTKKDIKKGTYVWNTDLSGRWLTQQQWESFLGMLPPYMQIDVVEWAYCMADKDLPDVGLMVHLDLEPSAMINHGGPDVPYDGFINCRPDNVEDVEIDSEYDDEWRLVAKHDIPAGSEILVDYTTFHDYKNTEDKLEYFEDSWEQIIEDKEYFGQSQPAAASNKDNNKSKSSKGGYKGNRNKKREEEKKEDELLVEKMKMTTTTSS